MSSLKSIEEAREIFLELSALDETYDAFREIVRQEEKIAGKTIDEWNEYFTLNFPQVPDMASCKEADVRLAQLHHDATFWFNLTKLCADNLTSASDDKFQIEFRRLYTQAKQEAEATNKRMPGADILNNLANASSSQRKRLSERASRDLEFWKKIIADLEFQRKAVNDATWNNGIEAKLLSST